MPADLSAVASNLTRSPAGIWVARQQRDVSYPADGNQSCFAVEDTSFWFRHRNRVITDLVQHHSPDRRFFDIGGGNGCVAFALQQAEIDVVLVEPGPTGALNAKQRGVCTVVQSTLEDAGFGEGSLPSAGLFDVVEHIENEHAFLSSIHRYLEPGGKLFVTVPAYQFLWSVDDVEAGHYRRYTSSSLKRSLEKSGFDVLYCGYLFSFLVPPIFLLRSLPSKVGWRKSVTEANTQKEHSQGGGFASFIVDRLLQWERERVRSGKRIPFGSSCLAVAGKPTR